MTVDPVEELRESMNRLRGRLFGALEATGMPEKQENAIKGLVRQLTYDAQASLEATLRRSDQSGGYRGGRRAR